MYIVAIRFIGAFPDGDKVVELSSPNGGGGCYHLSVANFYWGFISEYTTGWRVVLQIPNDEYSAGDLQPLIGMVMGDI